MNRTWNIAKIAALTALFLVLLADGLAHAQLAAKGYNSRPCGFDMDDDERVGEDGVQRDTVGYNESDETLRCLTPLFTVYPGSLGLACWAWLRRVRAHQPGHGGVRAAVG